MADVFDLSGRVVVVTGGLGQLGRRFSADLIGRGARVAIVDQFPCRDRTLGGLVPADHGDRLMTFVADITSRSDLEAALRAIETQWGAPYGLVNNAALDSPPDAPASENGPFEDYPEDSFDRIVAVNLKGTFLCCQVFGGAMARAGRGSIVNVGSIYGVVAPDQNLYEYRRQDGGTFFKPVAYSAAKSGVYNLTRYLAAYWGKQQVRVNTVTFAGVFNNQDPRFLEKYLPKVPLGRMAEPADYSGAMVYLLSDASRYMTGSNMVIDGGFTSI
ncbi:NAD(P)-dependent dehydrogenase (short-subunit alcohol dehydrogenase family) [Rhodopseudomonas thermotolerans]|uniref:NAD(P)-dependent dehydrogenase (Short-subunit alcohol dehydrogenase family) n=2 Tax=Rhodopseudomonas TaxID=1073 RepID=A0A336JJZ4_9BRAD|nr:MULTISPECIES: SDR family oxidoreductase [Rhodopseudomonas]RED37995.1 NAD(P)-dependent dehydrogenase (short-subunit alcohol dehydrogenase family) [Rhodopseudomonas pentothenatexigens]REG05188.1 NAD(P)-dependent dehydrogenase (short-subunit alcohol dehydrogenase family) [Rhodopseudomonas thermotolerans]SSW90020.1 NAD(P)-dependent dehydrogenase (short-subunit alcohol dehydrogenase family) [Rhodopseudomonas pentothenatexigens]